MQSQRSKLRRARRRLLLRSAVTCLSGATLPAIPSQSCTGHARTETADYQTATNSSGYLPIFSLTVCCTINYLPKVHNNFVEYFQYKYNPKNSTRFCMKTVVFLYLENPLYVQWLFFSNCTFSVCLSVCLPKLTSPKTSTTRAVCCYFDL